jgi:hypothetical protein
VEGRHRLRAEGDYYLKALRPSRVNPAPQLRPLLPSLPWNRVKPYVEHYSELDVAARAAVAGRCPRLWLITSHSGQSGGTHQSLLNLRGYEQLKDGFSRDYAHTTLRTFGWASPIHVYLYY